MEKVILLKTQLVEAAKFAKSSSFGHKRLAVILLDNFVEIQIVGLFQSIFSSDGLFTFKKKKYSHDKRQKILSHYDELIKAAVEEGMIDKDEQRLLKFCHEIRNSLYHRGYEDEVLTQIAILVLCDIITRRQPEWKSARGFTAYRQGVVDPYPVETSTKSFLNDNSFESWKAFLASYFIVEDGQNTVSSLVSDYLLSQVETVRQAFAFIKANAKEFLPHTEKWGFDDFARHYSFLYTMHNQLAKIKELPDKDERESEYEGLYKSFSASWISRGSRRLGVLEKQFQQIASLPMAKSIEKYISFRNEITTLSEAFMRAASKLEETMQLAYDLYRGK